MPFFAEGSAEVAPVGWTGEKFTPRTARVLLVAALVAGCGSTSPLPVTIVATFSGAVTGTAVVVAAAASNTSDNGQIFSIENTNTTYPVLSVSIEIAGPSLQTGTFTNTSLSIVQFAIELQERPSPRSPLWAATSGAAIGSFSLTLSSTGPSIEQNDSTVWNSPHGSFTAVLPAVPASAATGMVDVSVPF